MTYADYLQEQGGSLPNYTDISNPVTGTDTRPTIVFVNGYWMKTKSIDGPHEGGKNYWINADEYVNEITAYFNLENPAIIFVDGSCFMLSSSLYRIQKGYDWANDNKELLIRGAQTSIDFYFVSHSMGGAYSGGIMNFLSLNGHNVKKSVFLSFHQPQHLWINDGISSLQLLQGFWDPKQNQESIVHLYLHDPLADEINLHNVEKYCPIIRPDGNLFNVHGTTNGTDGFPLIQDSTSVYAITETENDENFITQSSVDHDTKFYKINTTKIDTNDPDNSHYIPF